MRYRTKLFSGTLVAAGLAAATLVVTPAANADVGGSRIQNASSGVMLAVGRGTLVNLSRPMSDLFVADPKVADVQVRSPRQLYVFGKGAGETTVYATDKSGAVVYSANVRVGNNYDQVRTMLHTAMPDSAIDVTAMNGIAILTGTVKSPDDVEEANRILQAIVGDKVTIVNRLKTATPMQVMLRVKISEVSRDLAKEIGVNLLSRDTTGGFLFGIGQGRNFGSIETNDTGGTTFKFNPTEGKTAINFAGNLLGLDLMAALDLLETDGSVTTLAQPSLTALSGETASFLAGGEFPIPIQQSLGTTTIEYKQYGVGLAFTPTVLNDGRISIRVRPEVSELSDAGSVKFGGYTIPALATRRAETTVELGSGQSFVIGGLLKNNGNTSMDKAPWLGDLPVLGALFRSSKYRRQETELVIVVTPYLVKPVSDSQIKLPTDGAKSPTDLGRVLGGQTFSGKSGAAAPAPRTAPAVSSAPSAAPAASAATASPAPGFSLN